jgi:hypothetical protein
MKRIILIVLTGLFSIALSAQNDLIENRPLNVIVVSIIGDGSNVSLNYERLVKINDNFFLTGRIGGGYGRQLTPGVESDTVLRPVYLTIPLQITLNAGKSRHFAEAGIGSTAAIGNVCPHILYYLTAGYRLQPLKSGNLSIRLYGNWLFTKSDDFKNLYFVPFGASIGIAF